MQSSALQFNNSSLVLSIAYLSLASFAGVAIAKSIVSLKAFSTSLIFSKSLVMWGYPSLKKKSSSAGVHLSSIFEGVLALFLGLLVLGALHHRRFLSLTRIPRRYHHSTSARLLIRNKKKKLHVNILLHDVTE
ncbi:hypothetical protein M9H77_11430 [Catharanthus roseus]|uniref:Uncharacterized protein n=1 Tax=Catharanthus roseus TaxID=4058 RepID=A0ACC0BEK9_CATRO|nr:hypothetical protein M9H77_11430 [Catharanthus roseus]